MRQPLSFTAKIWKMGDYFVIPVPKSQTFRFEDRKKGDKFFVLVVPAGSLKGKKTISIEGGEVEIIDSENLQGP